MLLCGIGLATLLVVLIFKQEDQQTSFLMQIAFVGFLLISSFYIVFSASKQYENQVKLFNESTSKQCDFEIERHFNAEDPEYKVKIFSRCLSEGKFNDWIATIVNSNSGSIISHNVQKKLTSEVWFESQFGKLSD